MNQPAAIGARLSLMMFLQFLIWGSWYVSVGNFVGTLGWDEATSGPTIFWLYTVGPIAAIVSPLFLGVIADRYFATQRVLALMHLLGGIVMLAIPEFVVGSEQTPGLLIGLVAVHMLCYMPTLGLTNTIAFTHIQNQERQFPMIRVFGTIGWIVAGFLLAEFMTSSGDDFQFRLAGYASLALAGYSMTLPHTPPPARGKRATAGEMFGLGALELLRDRSFLVFALASFLVCIPLAAYYQQAPIYLEQAIGYSGPEVPGRMLFGQIAEIVFMLTIPFFFVRLGVKNMIAIGILAWVVRYGMFATAADEQVRWLVMGGILLHGICYDFFFVTGQIYVDKFAPAEMRGQAQGFLVLITQGFGLGIGAQVVGTIVDATTEGGVRDWAAFWWYPAIGAAIILVLFTLLFRDARRGAR